MKYEPYDWQGLQAKYVIGVDEVGRGCLAGPVYAGAVILNLDKPTIQFKDSKTLSPKRRAVLADEIRSEHRAAVGFATVEEIEKLNILWAALLAMKRSVLNLGIPESDWKNCHILVDGNKAIPDLPYFKQTCLVKGDQRASPVAAASILAKVERDEKITEIGKTFPQYGFAENKAYGTAEHMQAIEKFGPCPEHRSKFAGVKEYWPPKKVVPQNPSNIL